MLPLLLHELLSDERCACSDSFCVSDARKTLHKQEIRKRSAALIGAILRGGSAFKKPILVSSATDALVVCGLSAISEVGAIAVPVPSGTVSARVEQAIRRLMPHSILYSDFDPSLSALCEELGVQAISMASATDSEPGSTTTSEGIDLDIALGMLTSGTSGKGAKAVAMPHHAVIGVCEAIARYLKILANDKIVMLPPPSFDYGLYQLFIAGLRGAHVIVPSGTARRFPSELRELIETHEATVLPLTPATARLNVPVWSRSQRPMPSIRIVSFTGSAFPQELAQPLATLFPNAVIVPMYGITEAKRCTYLPRSDYPVRLPSIGIPIPNCRIRVVSDAGVDAEVGEHGELEVESRSVMAGYLGDPESSSIRVVEKFGTRRLMTGDIGYRDSDGFLFWVGRADDIVKIGDRRISMKEIEAAILGMAGVTNAAVIQLSDLSLAAFFVSESGSADAEVRGLLAGALGDVALVPKRLRKIATMPITSNGKIDYEALRAQVVEAEE